VKDDIRGVLSLLQAYRVIKVPGVLKLSTITDPFKGESSKLGKYELLRAVKELGSFPKLKPISLKLLTSAGPNHSTSMLGVWKDILAWRESELLPSLKEFITLLDGEVSDFLDLFNSELDFLSDIEIPVPSKENKKLILGKLAEKEEAAGKVRVFAITDAITQSVLAPIHDAIFSVLKALPTDGTFNQDGPLKRLMTLHEEGALEGQTFYSYDLSAATDRLPIALQVQVLACHLGDTLAELWAKLLTDRDWWLINKDNPTGLPLRYAVGQPMGALSSWGMLALTHHTVVRYAANQVGIPDFNHYALLGDDIVIANTEVAKRYHEIMTKVLGVDINLSKSLVSEHSLEFAKRLITTEGEVSPVGAKNLLVALKTLKGIPSVLLDLTNKGKVFSEGQILRMLECLPTVQKTAAKSLVWTILGPFGFIPSKDAITSSLKISTAVLSESINGLLQDVDDTRYSEDLRTWVANCDKARKTVANIAKLESMELYGKCMELSPVLMYIFKDALAKSQNLRENCKPVPEPFENGPWNDKDLSYEQRIDEGMKYLTSRVKFDKNETVSIKDPFATDKVPMMLTVPIKPDVFWREVSNVYMDWWLF
jgi:hypothetical protein